MNHLLFPLFCLLGAGLATAAQQTGTVRAADQFLPGVSVTATQGGAKVATSTDDTGAYSLELTPGVWHIKLENFGFLPAERDVEAGNTAGTVDWVLEIKRFEPPPAPAATPVTPAAPAPPTASKAVVKGKRPDANEAQPGFVALTLIPTSEGEAIKLSVAAIVPPDVSAPASETGAAEAFLVSGSVSEGLENARAVDEQQVKKGDRVAKTTPATGTPAPDAPAPSLSSLFGDGPGGGKGDRASKSFSRAASKAISKPGTQRVSSFGNKKKDNAGMHGSLFFTLRNSALDARPYSLTGQTVDKPSYARSTFGVSAGGPLSIPKLISLNRTFIYFTYQGTRSRNPYSPVATLPTTLERSGDFSQSVARWPVQIYDPTNHEPFAGNIIPASRFSAPALGLMRFMPLPNQPGRVQNFQYSTSYQSNTGAWGGRLMQPLSRRDRLSFNVNQQSRDSVSPQVYGFRDGSGGEGFSATAGYSHTFGPRLISNLTWNFSRNKNETLPYFAFTTNVADELGINGTSEEPINYGPPNFSFTNFNGLADASAITRRDQTSSINEGFTLVLKKKHNIGFGVGYRRMQQNSLAYSNARGSFSFSGLMTSAFDASGQPLPGTGYDFADFLLGMPQSSSIRFGSENTYFRASAWDGYVTDDWRVRPGLTLNAGVRYEYFTPYRELFGHMANLDVNPTFTGVAVVTPGVAGPYTGTFSSGLVDSDPKTISPRIGGAWRPFPKKSTLVRAGYGLFYNGSVYNLFPSRMASQPPFAKVASLSTSTLNPLSIQNGFALQPSTTITNSYAVNRFYKVGYAQTFNLSVQHSLPWALVLEATYLGTKGTHLDIQRLPNRAMPGSPLTTEQRRQIGNAVGFTYEDSNGNSILHSGQLRVTRRFQKGLSANTLYTYGRSIDNVSTFGQGGTTVAQNDKDMHAERGLSSFDMRHQISMAWMFVSPVGPNGVLRNGGWRAKLLKDWTLSGGFNATSGTPMTARVLGNLANSGGTGAIGSGRADAVDGADVNGGGYRFFNLAAFAIPPSGRYGNAGRNTVPGPFRQSASASLGRTFKFGDTQRMLDLRCDTYNTFNHVSYTSVGTVINASNYGLPLATQPMRSVNMTLRFRF